MGVRVLRDGPVRQNVFESDNGCKFAIEPMGPGSNLWVIRMKRGGKTPSFCNDSAFTSFQSAANLLKDYIANYGKSKNKQALQDVR